MSDYKKLMGYGNPKEIIKERKKIKTKSLTESLKAQFGDTLNETLPAFPKEWKMLEKACYDLEKAVKILEKSVGRQDRSGSRTISGLWKYTFNSIKKFKDLVSKEVLSKLQ